MQIKVRSISKYPTSEELPSKSYVLVSKKAGGGFKSEKVTVETLIKTTENQISSDIEKLYNLSGVNVGNISSDVYKLYHENVELSGTKTFVENPIVLAQKSLTELSDNMVPTVGNVKTVITESDSFFGPKSIVEGNPDNATPKTDRDGILTSMVWKIPEGGNDSESYDDQTGAPKIVECKQSGLLTIYGWLTDDGNVQPQEAWVGLYGKVYVRENPNDETSTTSSKWVLLAL